jgi:hypothetical protein
VRKFAQVVYLQTSLSRYSVFLQLKTLRAVGEQKSLRSKKSSTKGRLIICLIKLLDEKKQLSDNVGRDKNLPQKNAWGRGPFAAALSTNYPKKSNQLPFLPARGGRLGGRVRKFAQPGDKSSENGDTKPKKIACAGNASRYLPPNFWTNCPEKRQAQGLGRVK